MSATSSVEETEAQKKEWNAELYLSIKLKCWLNHCKCIIVYFIQACLTLHLMQAHCSRHMAARNHLIQVKSTDKAKDTKQAYYVELKATFNGLIYCQYSDQWKRQLVLPTVTNWSINTEAWRMKKVTYLEQLCKQFWETSKRKEKPSRTTSSSTFFLSYNRLLS